MVMDGRKNDIPNEACLWFDLTLDMAQTTFYLTRGEHADYYTTDVFCK
jgi:hypothetical protein